MSNLFNYSRHLFKVLIALLLLSALIMFVLAFRTFVQEREYHNNSLTRSTQSTAREIELYVGGLRRALRIFATEEYELLARATTYSQIIPVVQEKITLHFPEQLAFALSVNHSQTPLINEPELFGEHCRANMDLYSRNEQDLDTGLSLHSSGPQGSEHFDVMATFPAGEGTSDEAGVIFVSFGIDDLERLLQSGSSSAYTLSLKNSEEKSIGELSEILLSANPSVTDDADNKPTDPDYSFPITGTPWMLHGSKNTADTARAWKASLVQTLIGTFVLIIAGLTAWRSVEQEKISRNRTTIVLNSVESERRRIARDLHDQVLSDVTHAKRLLMELEPINENPSPIDAGKLLAAQRSVDDFSTTIRTTIDELYPHTLENLGLCRALEAHLAGDRRHGPEMHLNFDKKVDTQLGPTQKLHTYRIITELINNALKHSACTKITIDIKQSPVSVVIRVIDDGKGFDNRRTRNPSSHGIDNIESRAMLLDAQHRWINDGTIGTCFEITIPLKPHDTA